MNVVNRFPGSAHDAHIWRQSNMSQLMETLYRRNNQNVFLFFCWRLRPWLLTPLRNTVQDTPEDRFNNRLKSIRNIVERCNGVLKNRWRCLLKHRVLHYSSKMAARVTKACCVLHNMCISKNIPLPDEDELQQDYGIYDGLYINDPAEYANENNVDLLVAR
ncbi:hypothetical protein NQ318_008099 [Aromia moschata]|uniref:DDE Tnp4 domain-containing protein n=1 Tax=Aromia moschata TaxID=1265417 RepID=A0AAV8YNB4_9CUCU|nr:hypothetical protein NQ318_008099 [Aromia moschata]